MAEAKSYSMADLHLLTEEVIDEINSSGRPALITKYGRIVAAIHPLEGQHIESLLLNTPEFAQRVAEADNG